ncbi:MAG: WecB/TagA/CpsF family glycosyltransferase, partial [Patescibacteria group bacterium]
NGMILGLKVTSTTRLKVLRFARERVSSGTKFFITTPNPEIIIKAQEDEKLKRIINRSDIALPDGIGLAQAHKFLRLPNPKDPIRRFLTLFIQGLGVGFLTIVDRESLTKGLSVIPGRGMFMDLVKLANKKKWRVYLLGGRRQVAHSTKKILLDSLKSVEIKSSQGPELTIEARPKSKKDKKREADSIKEINSFKPHLLFVAFDAGKQEKWVYRWFDKLDVVGTMVVGGTFDYVSGRTKLPPSWIEKIGLEWVWRLATGSQKKERIFKAFPEFPFRVFWEKFTSQKIGA